MVENSTTFYFNLRFWTSFWRDGRNLYGVGGLCFGASMGIPRRQEGIPGFQPQIPAPIKLLCRGGLLRNEQYEKNQFTSPSKSQFPVPVCRGVNKIERKNKGSFSSPTLTALTGGDYLFLSSDGQFCCTAFTVRR